MKEVYLLISVILLLAYLFATHASPFCRVPPLTSELSWKNEYWNSTYKMRGPNERTGDPGNYKQTTNNNLDNPNHLKCVNQGRWDGDTCSPTNLVSNVCYKKHLDQCMRKLGHTLYA